jgi:hypothetical protein
MGDAARHEQLIERQLIKESKWRYRPCADLANDRYLAGHANERTRRSGSPLLPALFSRHRVCEEILVLRYETALKAENLKAVAVADGPELHVGWVAVAVSAGNDPAHPVSDLVHGSIDACRPTP